MLLPSSIFVECLRECYIMHVLCLIPLDGYVCVCECYRWRGRQAMWTCFGLCASFVSAFSCAWVIRITQVVEWTCQCNIVPFNWAIWQWKLETLSDINDDSWMWMMLRLTSNRRSKCLHACFHNDIYIIRPSAHKQKLLISFLTHWYEK